MRLSSGRPGEQAVTTGAERRLRQGERDVSDALGLKRVSVFSRCLLLPNTTDPILF